MPTLEFLTTKKSPTERSVTEVIPEVEKYLNFSSDIFCVCIICHIGNPTIYNIIHWFAGPMGQTTCQPSI